MHLPAILVREKLLRSGVPKLCRMPETNASGSAVKNREPSTRPQSCICALRFLLVKIGLRSEVSDFPALPKTAIKPTAPKRKRDKYPLENSPLNAKTAFRRFPRTKPDVASQGLIAAITLRENPGPSIQCHEASGSIFEPP